MPQLFWYKLLFMTELLAAEFLFTIKLNKRPFFVWRLIAGFAACYGIAAVYPLLDFSGWYLSLMFLVLAGVSLLALKFAYRSSWMSMFFCVVTAYTVQHLSYELFALITSSSGLFSSISLYGSDPFNFADFSLQTLLIVFIFVDIYLFVYWSAYLLMRKRLSKNGEIELRNTSLLVLAALILIVDIVLNAFVVYIEAGYSQWYDFIICVYNILCCMLILYLQVMMVDVKTMQHEIEVGQQLLHQARLQYEISKENINLINLKCHNLKHEVRKFAKKGGIDPEYIDGIENIISIYDASVKTGNEALDVILTEKSLLCHSKGIKLTCMADCVSLGFISDGDLYVLFGNAVDNAVEAVSGIHDEEKRYIGLTVHSVGSMATINMNNYFEGALAFGDDGLPITTKSDKRFHGFGMKSIKSIVEKYNGDLSAVTSKNVFTLSIFFPIPPGYGADGKT